MSYLLRFARECASAVGVVVSAIYPPPVRVWDGADTLNEFEAENDGLEGTADAEYRPAYEAAKAARSSGQTKQYGPRPRISTTPPSPSSTSPVGCPTSRSVGDEGSPAARDIPPSPAGEYPERAGCLPCHGAGRIFWAGGSTRCSRCGGTGDVPAGGEATPPEAVAPPAGLTWAQWIEPAICDVLATHHPVDGRDGRCYCHVQSTDLVHDIYADWQAWREHVSPLIAERIETATQTDWLRSSMDPDPVRAADLRIAEALNTFEQHQKKTEK